MLLDLHSSIRHHMTRLSVLGVLAKMGVRHGDTLVLLSDEQIMEIPRRRRRQLPRVAPNVLVRCNGIKKAMKLSYKTVMELCICIYVLFFLQNLQNIIYFMKTSASIL